LDGGQNGVIRGALAGSQRVDKGTEAVRIHQALQGAGALNPEWTGSACSSKTLKLGSMFEVGAFSAGSNSVQTSGDYSGRSGFGGLRGRHFAGGFSLSFSSGKVHGPRLSVRSIAVGVDALNADSALCRVDKSQTCRICRSLAAALPLPSNPARLLTVRCHPAHTESQTPFS